MLWVVINMNIMKFLYNVYILLILVLLFVLTLNEWSEILIQKYEKSLGVGLGFENYKGLGIGLGWSWQQCLIYFIGKHVGLRSGFFVRQPVLYIGIVVGVYVDKNDPLRQIPKHVKSVRLGRELKSWMCLTVKWKLIFKRASG